LLNNGGGIHLDNTNYTRILNNTIKHSSGNGIAIGGNNNWISNNYLDNNTWGMGFDGGPNNIAIDNNVHNSSAIGIEVYCDNQTFLDNIITNNGLGIMISSSYNNISGNIANNNVDAGISLEGNNSIISGNTVSYNNYSGISVNNGDFNKITNNIANYNAEHGLSLAVNYSTVSGNTANHNDQFGIMINGDFNNVSENTASYNGQNGITLDGNSDNCILFLNDITGNLLHSGYDDGTNNQWDNGTIGHYWDEYTGKDADDDGIGDTPYTIPGAAGSQDNYPIWWDAPIISIDSPTANATFSNTAPGYEISIEGIPQSMWYTIEGIAGNFPITELNGIIDQDTWDSLDDGDITITFYAQDSESEIGSLSIIVIKYIPSTSSTDGIPGYNLFFLFGVLSVVAIIISIKLKRIKK
jgi:parallel beta-helix repeat protein